MNKLIEECENLKQAYRFLRKIEFDGITVPHIDEDVLNEYECVMRILVKGGSNYPWEQILEIEELHNEIEKRLPNVMEDEFEEYIYLGDLLGVLQTAGR